MSAGDYTTCAALPLGGLKCWGYNAAGQLGNGYYTDALAPVDVNQDDLTTGRGIETEFLSTCGLNADGTAWCWGDNSYGQLGLDPAATPDANVPVVIGGLSNVARVATAPYYACALNSSGTASCWGTGTLGDGATSFSTAPVGVSGVSSGVRMSASYDHACVTLVDGASKCWGPNTYGEVGTGNYLSAVLPTSTFGIRNAIDVQTGVFSSCAVLSTGALRCWGAGPLGNGTTSGSATPVSVSGISTAVAVAVGWYHTCAVLADSTVTCWGDNAFGQLGNDPATTAASNLPVAVPNLSNVVGLSAGYLHTCAALSTGQVACWGLNASGQLGDGTDDDSWAPVVAF